MDTGFHESLFSAPLQLDIEDLGVDVPAPKPKRQKATTTNDDEDTDSDEDYDLSEPVCSHVNCIIHIVYGACPSCCYFE